ncbi:MAG: hypothetical protein A2Y21_04455 [Clostridiales bacterium GWC2_40_7]|nr:MAG: hypothetical protein A2Y21_04455 [Clostridiales bacterium GWC2_40_7]
MEASSLSSFSSTTAKAKNKALIEAFAAVWVIALKRNTTIKVTGASSPLQLLAIAKAIPQTKKAHNGAFLLKV